MSQVSKKASNMSAAQPGLNKTASQKSLGNKSGAPASPQKSVSPDAKSRASAIKPNATLSVKNGSNIDVTKSQNDLNKSVKSNADLGKSIGKAPTLSPDQKANKFAALKSDFKKDDALKSQEGPMGSVKSGGGNSPPKSPEQQKSQAASALKGNSQLAKSQTKSQMDLNKSQSPSRNDPKALNQTDLNKSMGQNSLKAGSQLNVTSQQPKVTDLDKSRNASNSPPKVSQKEANKSQESLQKQESMHSMTKMSNISKGDAKITKQPIGQSLQVSNGGLKNNLGQPANPVAQSQALGKSAGVNESGTILGGKDQHNIQKSQAQAPMTTITQSQNLGNSLDKLDTKLKVLTQKEVEEQEFKDNQSLASHKQKLESLQRQKPPTKQDDLVQYLLKRLEAAESSIKAAEEVITNERTLRHSTSKQMKSEIASLNHLVEVEKTNLSQKVSAELDNTLKKAVRDKIQMKKELDIVVDAKEKLQREFDELQEMYNKQVRQNIEMQQRQSNLQDRGYNKAPEPQLKQSVYLPPIQNKYQQPVQQQQEDDDDDFWYSGGGGGGGYGNRNY